MASPWSKLSSLATTQHGVVHVDQARALGIPTRTLYDHTERRNQIYRGVLLAPGSSATFEARAMGAVLAGGSRSAVTGLTALFLHGGVDVAPRNLQIAVPADRAKPTLKGVDDIVRTTTITSADLDVARSIRSVGGAWALLHAGRQLPARRVLELLVTMEQRGIVDRSRVIDVLGRAGRAKGSAHLRTAMSALTDDVVDSLLELDARQYLRQMGLMPHPSPFPFRCPDRRVIHLDVPYPSFWFAFECDSPQSRSGGRSFHTDRTRWSQAQRGGWKLGWITRDRLLTDAAGIIEEVLEARRTFDPQRPPPVATPCAFAKCGVCAPLRERPRAATSMNAARGQD